MEKSNGLVAEVSSGRDILVKMLAVVYVGCIYGAFAISLGSAVARMF